MLLSRVADALYWISRYLERAEHTARLIDVRLDLGLDRQPRPDGWDFERLYATLRLDAARRRAALEPGGARRRAGVRPVEPRLGRSPCVTAARENARQVREEISSDMWEQINALFLRFKQARARGHRGRPGRTTCRALVIEGVHLFQGVTDATMGHGEGWQYLQVGRFLERAGATAALRRICTCRRGAAAAAGHARMGGPAALVLGARGLLPLLHRRSAAERIAEFLLLNVEFPRSVRFAAARVESALRTIAATHRPRRRRPGRAARRPAACVARLRAGGRDPQRRSARVSRRHRRATARRSTRRFTRATSRIRSNRRFRPDGSACTTPSATSHGSPTRRPSPKA